MKDQVAIQKLMREKLTQAQLANPAVSVNRFARRYGLAPSATYEILKGSRRVSRKMAEKIAVKLMLNPAEKAALLNHFPDSHAHQTPSRSRRSTKTQNTLILTHDQFTLISEWVNYAILSLVKTSDFKPDIAWIANRLGVLESTILQAVERLERLGLLKRTAKAWVRTPSTVFTKDDILDTSIQKSHLTDMDLARDSLLRDPVSLRDFTSFTLPVDPARLPRAKRLIRETQLKLAKLVASSDSTEVYRVSTYLFPLTRVRPPKKHEETV